MIALIGKCLESIIGEKVDSLQVAFTPEASRISNKSINDLIALWLPIVTTVLAYIANIIDKDLSEILSENDSLESVSSKVSTFIYVSQATNPNPAFTSFKGFISPKG
ncbi:MAG: hypothetical protein V7K89_27360 [Nostoc sp.]|uniref:hypothetical protein n=1 Tax=Nostoc sp. TaxID=1180 RepID=UPI002FFB4045